MPRTRYNKLPTRKQSKSTADSSDEVSANQVIDTLLGLFTELGLNVSHPIASAAKIGRTITTAHTLYPYASEIGQLLTYWHQDPEYLDERGNPLRIRLGGKGPSFRRLAQLKAPKIDISFLLSELERLGAISIDEGKLISVNMRSFPVYEDKRLAVQHTLNALNGFIKTLRHNLDSSPSNSDQLFHRIAWNDDFDDREIPALKIRAKRQGQSFLESFDDWLARRTLSKPSKKRPGSQKTKVSIGIYLSVERK